MTAEQMEEVALLAASRTAERIHAEMVAPALARAERWEQIADQLASACDRERWTVSHLLNRVPVRDVSEGLAEADVALATYRAAKDVWLVE